MEVEEVLGLGRRGVLMAYAKWGCWRAVHVVLASPSVLESMQSLVAAAVGGEGRGGWCVSV